MVAGDTGKLCNPSERKTLLDSLVVVYKKLRVFINMPNMTKVN